MINLIFSLPVPENVHILLILPKDVNPSTSQINAGVCSGLTLHFDKLSVLSLPKEAALPYPAFKGGDWRRRMGQLLFPIRSVIIFHI